MRRLIVSLLLSAFVVLSSFGLGTFVYADTSLTPDQTTKIQANCVSIKNTLSQLHASDALLRVNRGQLYESMASNLMDSFNSRLGSNGLDNKAMTTVTGTYRSQLDTFRSDYIAYEQKLSDAINVDCTKNPTDFHNAIQSARTLRGVVHDDVTKLDRSIDDYRSSVSDFLLNYQRISQ